jgi:sugar phosphate isomerase/epimerase
MRLGCAAYSYRQQLQDGSLTLEGFLDRCVQLGLDGVELTAYYFPATDTATLNCLKLACARRGLHIAGTAIGSNFARAGEDECAREVQQARDWIDHSVTLGAPYLRVFAGGIPAGGTEMDAVNSVVRCLREVLPYAEERGVVLALENHGGVTSTAQQVLRLLEILNSPNLGVNLDFGNFRNDPYTEFQMLAPYTVTAHAKSHMAGPKGHEAVDYGVVNRIMRAAGYRGYVNIEYEESEPADEAVPRFVQYLRRCLATPEEDAKLP